MGIWLLCICFLVLIAVLFGIAKGLDIYGAWFLRKNTNTGKIEWQHEYVDADVAAMIFGSILIISAVVMFVFLIGFTVAGHIGLKYDLLEVERENLINLYNSATDNDKNVIIGNIAEFNKKLLILQYEHNNPWLSWFTSSRVMDIQVITL